MDCSSKKKQIIVFSNSVGLYVLPDPLVHESCINKLDKEYALKGIWLPGLTIFDVKKHVDSVVCGKKEDTTIILNIGVCECTTVSPIQFLALSTHLLLTLGTQPEFQTYVFGKMREAAHFLSQKEEVHLPILYPNEYINIYKDILNFVQGCKVFCCGIPKPNPNISHKGIRATEVNKVLKELVDRKNGCEFVDLYNTYPEYITDGCHYNNEGHQKLFEMFKSII